MRDESLKFLEKLLNTPSPSGHEARAQRVWLDYVKAFADETFTDSYGNAVAVLNKGGSPRIMLAGHADEIGMTVNFINKEGFIYVRKLGGVDPAITKAQRVVIHSRKGPVNGVVGNVAPHLMKQEGDRKPPKIEELFIDIGLMLQANRPVGTGALSGVSASPTGGNFTGDYHVRYDQWMNFIGPAPGGGTGSTQLTAGGLFTAGNVAHFAGAGDGLWFAASGEGGTATDYRVYIRGANQAATTGFYAAGSQNNSAAYYTANFPGNVTAPAEQTALHASQTGNTAAGTLGWAWHDVVITKDGNIVTWNVDGIRIATVDITTAGAFGGNNILFAQSDINTTQTTAAGDPVMFGLIDNVRVMAVPEPSTYALLGIGALLAAGMRRRWQ